MSGVDYYHCEECGRKMLYIHQKEEDYFDDSPDPCVMYCNDCYKQLRAENEKLKKAKLKKALLMKAIFEI